MKTTTAARETTLLCRKIYRQDLDIAAMPEQVVKSFYKTEAPHTMYIGQVVAKLGPNP